jgi:hypothetical protein
VQCPDHETNSTFRVFGRRHGTLYQECDGHDAKCAFGCLLLTFIVGACKRRGLGRRRVEEEADRRAVVGGDATPLVPPRTHGVLDQPLGRLLPVRRRRHDLHGLVVGDHVPDLPEKFPFAVVSRRVVEAKGN